MLNAKRDANTKKSTSDSESLNMMVRGKISTQSLVKLGKRRPQTAFNRVKKNKKTTFHRTPTNTAAVIRSLRGGHNKTKIDNTNRENENSMDLLKDAIRLVLFHQQQMSKDAFETFIPQSKVETIQSRVNYIDKILSRYIYTSSTTMNSIGEKRLGDLLNSSLCELFKIATSASIRDSKIFPPNVPGIDESVSTQTSKTNNLKNNQLLPPNKATGLLNALLQLVNSSIETKKGLFHASKLATELQNQIKSLELQIDEYKENINLLQLTLSIATKYKNDSSADKITALEYYKKILLKTQTKLIKPICTSDPESKDKFDKDKLTDIKEVKDNSHSKMELAHCESVIENLRKKVESLEIQTHSKRESLQEHSNRLATERTCEIDAIQANENSLVSRLESAESTKLSLQHQVNKKVLEVKSMQRIMREFQEESSKTSLTYSSKLSTLQSQLDLYKSELQTAERKREDTIKQVEKEYQSNMKIIKGEIKADQQKIVDKNKSTYEMQRSQLSAQISQLKSQVSQLKVSEASRHREREASFTVQLSMMQAEVDRLKSSASLAKDSARREMQSEIDRLGSVASLLKAEVKRLTELIKANENKAQKERNTQIQKSESDKSIISASISHNEKIANDKVNTLQKELEFLKRDLKKTQALSKLADDNNMSKLKLAKRKLDAVTEELRTSTLCLKMSKREREKDQIEFAKSIEAATSVAEKWRLKYEKYIETHKR